MTEPISLHPRTHQAITLAEATGGKRMALPVDLIQDAARRLQFLFLFVLGVSLINSIFSELAGVEINRAVRYTALGFAWIVTLVALYLVRSDKLSPKQLLNLGLGYEIFMAGVVSAATIHMMWTGDRPALVWSPVSVWILLYPIIVPNTTRKTLIASAAAAATEPLVVLALVGAGVVAAPALPVFVRNLWPSILAIGIATAIARMLYRLGEKLSKARAMGSYQLTEQLGEGGMGEVWKAKHRLLARDAAVKLIHPEALGGADDESAMTMFQRFEREAQATAALRSPHTIEVFDFGIARDGTFYYVMELLDGFDLASLVSKYGAQPPERVVYLLRQACHSLQEAHSRGLIHRDIKPANIFVCRYGEDFDFVKVLDFGLVKERETEEQPSQQQLTQIGAIAGTPAYMPPEMIMGEGPVDGRADLYALGCVVYWLLTGMDVFQKPNMMAVLAAHLKDTPVPVAERTSGNIPAGLDRITMACLEKDPADRPQSARELARMLGDLDLDQPWSEERGAQWWEEHGRSG